MPCTLTAQTCGSVLVVVAFAGSDLAARLLDACPGSELAWFVNLAVFAPFERAVPPLLGEALTGPGTPWRAAALIGLALSARALRFRLGVAALAHLGFAASVALAHAWMTGDATGTVSLAALRARGFGGTCLVGALLAASGTACILGHAAFLRAIRAEGRHPAATAAVGQFGSDDGRLAVNMTAGPFGWSG